MRVFVTGATGFVGSAIVSELLGVGHQVVGLARSETAAEALAAAGAEAHRGSLEDLTALANGAARADGVIHAAFTNVSPTTDYATSARADAAAIRALGEALAGTDRPLVVTSGTALASVSGRSATEEDPGNWGPRVVGEEAVHELVERGVHASVVRLASSVHDGHADRRGFVPRLVSIAREKGVSGYVGDGTNRWTGVHRADAGVLFRLTLEQAKPGATFHGVAEEGVPLRRIAEAIGNGLGLPTTSVRDEEAGDHFGHMALFVTLDDWSSSEQTKAQLGWRPGHLGLIDDIEHGGYLS
ncbi:MAG: SDR family oxidoreductase [Actinomycetota bacterium]|jgi:nucleoside-diphosphate-sugar epimerase|nr:SDR family oxidoreductase [Actinomycetota bacterium]